MDEANEKTVLRFWNFALNSAFCKGGKFEFQTRRCGFKSLSFPAAWSLANQLSSLCLSTLNIVGRDGIRGKILPKLTDEETALLQNSANCLKEIINNIEI